MRGSSRHLIFGIQIAPLFNPFIVVVLSTFCGVTIPFNTMEKFWRSWLYQLDPYTRLLSPMLSTELQYVMSDLLITVVADFYVLFRSGLTIRCRSNEFNIFNPPSGQTCQAWAGEFVNAFGGYLDNPNDTSSCRYCQYAVGDQYFEPLNIKYSNRWRDVWILFAFFSTFEHMFCLSSLLIVFFIVFNVIVTISEYIEACCSDYKLTSAIVASRFLRYAKR